MAAVVLVHGIAQEQKTADELESQWLPALAGGVRTAGQPQLADRLWRSGTSGLDVRMAYYGDLFLDPGAQGGGSSLDRGMADLAADPALMAEQLATAWLAAAAQYAADTRDQTTATRELANVTDPRSDAQGARAALRPAVNGLTRLRWFAPYGVAVAGKFVWRALSQVTGYLSDDTVRTTARQRVLDLVDRDTHLVIAHSLGTVVAYEALHCTQQPTALITLGSPLGLRNVIYERLRPYPATVPSCLTQWVNFASPDDLVAAHTDLAPFFPAAPNRNVTPTSGPPLDNGAQPHDAAHYLGKRSVGAAVAHALTDHTSDHAHD